MTLAEYFDKCQFHDWFYEYAEDGSAWRAGLATREMLKAEAAKDPAKAAIFQAWHAHMFSGPTFGTPKAPQPVRP